MSSTWLGLIAGAVTSIAVVPQLVKAYRSKHVRDISIWQPVILVVGMLLWLAYGFMINDVPLIAANFFSIICNGALIVMKFVYQKGDKTLFADYLCKKQERTEEL